MASSMVALCAQLVDPEPLYEEVSRLHRRHAEVHAILLHAEHTLLQASRAASAEQRLQDARQGAVPLRARLRSAKAACEEDAPREASLMARLDAPDLFSDSSREEIGEELQNLEQRRQQFADLTQAFQESAETIARFETDAACEASLLTALEAEVSAQRAALEELQVARTEAQSRLAAMKTAEQVAIKAEVSPYVDLKAAVSSWPELASHLRVSLVFAVGEKTWPLADAVGAAQITRENTSDRSLLRVHGLTELVVVDQRTATAILTPPSPPNVTSLDVLREVLGQSGKLRVSPEVLDVVYGPSGLSQRKDTTVPTCFVGSLRQYQLEGFRWLVSNHSNRFGSLLADDMGLGKTIQTVCLLCHLKEQRVLTTGSGWLNKHEVSLHGPALVVAPTSLLQNWRRELSRWAPTLRVCDYIGAGRVWPAKADVVLTSYGIVLQGARPQARRRIGHVSALVLDEAQRVKNHSAAVSRACKYVAAVCPGMKVALSGTPVENRLEEVHSIFEVISPGYLGTLEEFKRSFVPRKDKVDASKLRRVLDPFMLRRLKSDPAICPELPSKVDMRHDVELTEKQERLYKITHEHFMTAIATACNRRMRGAQIFAMIHALRKVCNHPATYETPPAAFSELVTQAVDESGKTKCFVELVEGILQQGEKCLVFVQYLNTIELLRGMLKDALETRAVAFTGALDANQRAEVVETFQHGVDCKVCFATLGAGGVGLNLTAASHVVHFDRCYNPAVEEQGSDRVHRIGQQRTVIVHRLIAQGTFEERIDAIMQEKQHLRDVFSKDGSLTWLSDYNDVELRDMFALHPSSPQSRGGAKSKVSPMPSDRDRAPRGPRVIRGLGRPRSHEPVQGRPQLVPDDGIAGSPLTLQQQSVSSACAFGAQVAHKTQLQLASPDPLPEACQPRPQPECFKHAPQPAASGLLARLLAKRAARASDSRHSIQVPLLREDELLVPNTGTDGCAENGCSTREVVFAVPPPTGTITPLGKEQGTKGHRSKVPLASAQRLLGPFSKRLRRTLLEHRPNRDADLRLPFSSAPSLMEDKALSPVHPAMTAAGAPGKGLVDPSVDDAIVVSSEDEATQSVCRRARPLGAHQQHVPSSKKFRWLGPSGSGGG